MGTQRPDIGRKAELLESQEWGVRSNEAIYGDASAHTLDY